MTAELGFSKVFDTISSIVLLQLGHTERSHYPHRNFVRVCSFNLCMPGAVTYVLASNFLPRDNIIEWSFSKMWIIFRLENQNGIPFDDFYSVHCVIHLVFTAMACLVVYIQSICIRIETHRQCSHLPRKKKTNSIIIGHNGCDCTQTSTSPIVKANTIHSMAYFMYIPNGLL